MNDDYTISIVKSQSYSQWYSKE